jgi:hypothetical protein
MYVLCLMDPLMNICDYSDEVILVKAFLKPDEEIIVGEAVCLEKQLQKDNWVVTNIFWLLWATCDMVACESLETPGCFANKAMIRSFQAKNQTHPERFELPTT